MNTDRTLTVNLHYVMNMTAKTSFSDIHFHRKMRFLTVSRMFRG